ncbi:MAG: MFS transporter [Planctomycetota bacterium]
MSAPTRTSLSRDDVQRGLRLSVVEGSAFALMVGLGETYIVADAIRLGASTLVLGLLVTLPLFVGSLGPLASLRVLRGLSRRKGFIATANVLQGLNLAVIGLSDHQGWTTPLQLLLASTLHQLLGQAAGTAWTSWFGDLIPAVVRGSYVAMRNRFVYGGVSVGILAGGGLLEWLEPAVGEEGRTGLGFTAIFALAGLARLLSAVLILRTPEPRFAGIATGARVKRFLRTARGSRAWRIVVFGFFLQLTVYVSGPYYTPYMLENLSFSYVEFTLASLAVTLVKVTMLPAWGRAVDQQGPRASYATTCVLLALVPLPWVFVDSWGWVLLAQAFSGLAWGGYEVSLFGLMVASSYRDTRTHVSAVQQVVNGAAQLLGGLLGAGVAATAGGDLTAVFAASCGLRMVAALAVPFVVPRLRGEEHVHRHTVFLRVVGFRANAGLEHRVLVAPDVPPMPPDEVLDRAERDAGEATAG